MYLPRRVFAMTFDICSTILLLYILGMLYNNQRNRLYIILLILLVKFTDYIKMYIMRKPCTEAGISKYIDT